MCYLCGLIKFGERALKIYKNVTLPEYCIVGSDTFLNKNQDFEPYTLICNERQTVMKVKGIYLDRDDCAINR